MNYKRRVDRDRDLARKVTIEVLKDFSVLDDVRAREHEELNGGFKAVAEEIERVTSKYGLETSGGGRALQPAHPRGAAACACRGHRRPDVCGDPAARIPNRGSGSARARVAVAEPEPECALSPR